MSFACHLQSLRLRSDSARGAKEPGGCGRAQREVDKISVIRQTESDVGGKRGSCHSICHCSISILDVGGTNPVKMRTVRWLQIRKTMMSLSK